VTCIFCQWTTERPKAFRMRQHILACPKVPDADRDKIRASQELKDKANAAKVAGAAANDKLMAENSGGGPDMDLGIGTSELTPPPSATDPSRKRKADPKDLNRLDCWTVVAACALTEVTSECRKPNLGRHLHSTSFPNRLRPKPRPSVRQSPAMVGLGAHLNATDPLVQYWMPHMASLPAE
jgi:hypothetical protein